MSEVTAPLTVRDAIAQVPSARQHIRFAFYRVRPEWRLRPATERAADREEVAWRVSILAITDEGRRRLQTIMERRRAEVRDRLACWKPEELNEFISAMGRYNASLEEPER